MSGANNVDDELATLEAIYGEEYRLISNENECEQIVTFSFFNRLTDKCVAECDWACD